MTMTKYNDVINKNIILEDGCEFSDSCLNCPLPLCKYDDPILDKSKLKNNTRGNIEKQNEPMLPEIVLLGLIFINFFPPIALPII